MNRIQHFITTLLVVGLALNQAHAHKPYVDEGTPVSSGSTSNSSSSLGKYRANCTQSTSFTDLNINNVRARLLGGGDKWWNLDEGRYVVPNVKPGSGLPEVSSIFAGGIWLGGFDDGNNLKMAAQTFRSGTRNDFWSGPLEENSGETTEEACQNWDKHFEVRGPVIAEHVRQFRSGEFSCDDVDVSLKAWPGKGNPYFAEINGFQLPNQSLAPFFDEDGDGLYDPCEGDYPIIEVIGCATTEPDRVGIADQMIWWVFNDNGNIHTNTTGDPIRMEIHALAFAYKTGDEVNDMTFYRYKLINRAIQSIDSTFFAQWVDPDLGCPQDDYIGCDTSRSLAVVYNSRTVDGLGGCNGINSYGNEVPMLGIDYFRGPKDEFGKELGMSSFVYYVNGGIGGNPSTSDPSTGQQYYNYLSGSWRDGSSFRYGGTGYQSSAVATKYAFTDSPDDPNGWSMCTQTINGADMRTVQASGPFRLEPGAINELIIGVAWVPDVLYPCPNLGTLLAADDLSQALFDNCFKITDGPDAPSIDIVELDQELILLLTNDSLSSNNHRLGYEARDLQAPDILADGTPNTDTLYRFEGYKVYQVVNDANGIPDLADPEQARLIFQADLNNGVNKIYNWEAFPGTVAEVPVFVPELMVDGGDKGIESTLRVTEDQFATGNRKLINHKNYYFTAVAYAYNNWQPFDPISRTGQRKPYLEGRNNVALAVGIPRVTAAEFGGLTINAAYGDGVQITRVDGSGNGGNFVDLTQETLENIIANGSSQELVYEVGEGPIDVKVVDPLRLVAGEYELRFYDDNMADDVLDTDARWVLTDPDGVQWFSETGMNVSNEQLVMRLNPVTGESESRGISIKIGQVDAPGYIPAENNNGFIGAEASYATAGDAWYAGVPSTSGFQGALEFIQTGSGQVNEAKDPDQIYSNVLSGAWFPMALVSNQRADGVGAAPFLTPWGESSTVSNLASANNLLKNLRNVDIVFTSDKDKWSRCVVVETANKLYRDEGWTPVPKVSNPNQSPNPLDLRQSPSVNKEGNSDGSNTIGLGWFPGYAVDALTGERLNIFFGENSVYRADNFGTLPNIPLNGADMIWNPTDATFVDGDGSGAFSGMFELVMGSQHFIYVHNTKYDACAAIHQSLSVGSIGTLSAVYRNVGWASFPILLPTTSLKSVAEGLIPNDLTVKLRVNSPYVHTLPKGTNSGHPAYRFSLSSQAPTKGNTAVAKSALDLINVVPNPYYAYSAYELQENDTRVKIVNLPSSCTVTIYSLDGKFIRQYKRDENPNPTIPAAGLLPEQLDESIEWDLKNAKNIPVASGVYLIHVNAPGLGERVIKWFGINRSFDTSNL